MNSKSDILTSFSNQRRCRGFNNQPEVSTTNAVTVFPNSKSRKSLCCIFIAASLIISTYCISTGFMSKKYKEILRCDMTVTLQNRQSKTCGSHCRLPGTEALPKGIVAQSSNLEMRPLWDSSKTHQKDSNPMNLLAIAVGIKQKEIVNHIIKKFISNDFVVMLFHYDGVVDEWGDLEWYNRVIHVSAMNQTKWWFAKRFLHPDVVADYDYIFLWDEDLGVENFHPIRYMSIVTEEGLEISQPALDVAKSEVHHPITARVKNLIVHRRMYKDKGSGRCDGKSKAPPCVGWVEMMAPVFSRAAWRCAWYMIQNDLIHAWGLDKQLGYCAQGDRSKNVGVVDSEYIVHLGVPTLGIFNTSKACPICFFLVFGAIHSLSWTRLTLCLSFILLQFAETTSNAHGAVDDRVGVRMRSYMEMHIFEKRWNESVMEDKNWLDPY